jgi:hypothetical protein
MANVNMKWRNLNLAVRIKLDAGAQKVLFIICLFITVGLSIASKVVLGKMEFIVGMLAVALGIGLVQTHKSEELEQKAAKDNLVDALSKLKLAKMGQVQEKPSCEDPGAGAAHG